VRRQIKENKNHEYIYIYIYIYIYMALLEKNNSLYIYIYMTLIKTWIECESFFACIFIDRPHRRVK
jgi:hypothetical protein